MNDTLQLVDLFADLEEYLGRNERGPMAVHFIQRCKAVRIGLQGIKPQSQEWLQLVMKDARVQRAVRVGLDAEQIAIMLAKDNDKLVEQIMKLHAIAPRKIKLPDGSVRVWHCPHEHIPETTL